MVCHVHALCSLVHVCIGSGYWCQRPVVLARLVDVISRHHPGPAGSVLVCMGDGTDTLVDDTLVGHT